MTPYMNANVEAPLEDILDGPLIDRIMQLTVCGDRASLRDLQEMFPIVVDSIFGRNSNGFGWGLRTTSRELQPQEFECLYDFLGPQGPLIHWCYRLLSESIKYEFSLDNLPPKLTETILSGQYSIFYADLVNVDPFRRQVTALSLNAFDYYILNYVLYATIPVHRMHPAAMQVHNDHIKTVYFYLTAEYLCFYMPGCPDSIVKPTNICPDVKMPQPLPVQTLQPPMRKLRYLKVPNVNLYANNNTTTATIPTNTVIANDGVVVQHLGHITESSRLHVWRTETVMHFFIDVWLHYDFDAARDLPSSEFIRVVRILVKQTHSFANSAFCDHSYMAALRRIAHPLMSVRIYPFLKSLVTQWPIDCSLLVVMELWLSYIQPWRYTYETQRMKMLNLTSRSLALDIPITNNYNTFIADNLVVYTQIFVNLLPRLERLDFSSQRNVIMLHRILKVFAQPTLPRRLCQAEQTYGGSTAFATPENSAEHSNYLRYNKPINGSNEWDTIPHETESYTPMFMPAFRAQTEHLIITLNISRMYVQQEIDATTEELQEKRNSHSFLRRLIFDLFVDKSTQQKKLTELRKIPTMLEQCIRSLSCIFSVKVPEDLLNQSLPHNRDRSKLNLSMFDNSDYLDLSKLNPIMMQNNLQNLKPPMDPALMPIGRREITPLVRLLHKLSCRINEMYSDEIKACWDRTDFAGKIIRQFIYEPITTQWFDKPQGISELCEEDLPPRICLRVFASYKFYFLNILSLIVGQYLWGTPLLGILALVALTALYVLMSALLT